MGRYSPTLGRNYTDDEQRRVDAGLEALRLMTKRMNKLHGKNGRRSLWTAADQARLEAGPHYDRADPYPAGVVGPKPLHMQREQARRAAEEAAGVVVYREPVELVTEHLPPWRRMPLEELPSAPAAFAKAAAAAGLTVAARYAGDAVQVGVRHRDRNALWMRAMWHRAASGLWTTKGVVVEGSLLGVTAAKALWK